MTWCIRRRPWFWPLVSLRSCSLSPNSSRNQRSVASTSAYVGSAFHHPYSNNHIQMPAAAPFVCSNFKLQHHYHWLAAPDVVHNNRRMSPTTTCQCPSLAMPLCLQPSSTCSMEKRVQSIHRQVQTDLEAMHETIFKCRNCRSSELAGDLGLHSAGPN